jgi:hypothetical protein
MKISKTEERVLKQQLQLGFMQAWMAKSRARKPKQSTEVRQEKRSILRWFAFWRRPVQSVKPVPSVGQANAVVVKTGIDILPDEMQTAMLRAADPRYELPCEVVITDLDKTTARYTSMSRNPSGKAM